MYIHGVGVIYVDLKICTFTTLWKMIKTPQNFVEGYSIKSTKICKKAAVKFWPQFSLKKRSLAWLSLRICKNPNLLKQDARKTYIVYINNIKICRKIIYKILILINLPLSFFSLSLISLSSLLIFGDALLISFIEGPI